MFRVIASAAGLAALFAVAAACSKEAAQSQTFDRTVTESTASCLPEDFLEGRLDSNVFSLSEEQISEINADDIGIELAREIVLNIASGKGCEVAGSEPFYDSTRSECKDIIDDMPASQACFVSTRVGDFFVIFDYLGGANIVFNRLD